MSGDACETPSGLRVETPVEQDTTVASHHTGVQRACARKFVTVPKWKEGTNEPIGVGSERRCWSCMEWGWIVADRSGSGGAILTS